MELHSPLQGLGARSTSDRIHLSVRCCNGATCDTVDNNGGDVSAAAALQLHKTSIVSFRIVVNTATRSNASSGLVAVVVALGLDAENQNSTRL